MNTSSSNSTNKVRIILVIILMLAMTAIFWHVFSWQLSAHKYDAYF